MSETPKCVCGHDAGSHDHLIGYCRAQRPRRNPCGCRTFAADANANRCTVPPDGWTCSRGAGHTGPCAASPDVCGRNGTSDEVEDLPHTAAPARPAPQGAPDDSVADAISECHGAFVEYGFACEDNNVAAQNAAERRHYAGLHALLSVATLRAQAVAGAVDAARLREIADFLHAHARDEGGYSEALRADIESDAAFLRSLTTPERAP